MQSFSFLTYSGPTLIVYVVGIVLSLMTWRRHPTVSLLALCGFGLLFFSSIFGLALNVWLVSVNSRGVDPEGFGRVIAIVSGFRSLLLSPIAFGFLMAAIFRRRSDQVQVWEA